MKEVDLERFQLQKASIAPYRIVYGSRFKDRVRQSPTDAQKFSALVIRPQYHGNGQTCHAYEIADEAYFRKYLAALASTDQSLSPTWQNALAQEFTAWCSLACWGIEHGSARYFSSLWCSISTLGAP
ncbi:hypothetical protein KL906_004562 [Ogataea polymorpha]|nr:hypothetical protein KL906_004562 [Ogataea polymorpha]